MTQPHHRLSNPSSSILEARKWAANSLPRLIFIALGLHMLFCFLLMTELHDHHGHVKHVLLKPKGTNRNIIIDIDGPRPRLHPRKDSLQASKLRLSDDEAAPIEADDLYIEHLHDTNNELQATLNITDSVSCRWRKNSYSIYAEDCGYHISARKGAGRVAIFNPAEQTRILCDGTRIAPAGIRILEHGDLNCSEPARLFTTVPSIHAKADMDTIELRFRASAKNKMPRFPCDVPCTSDQPFGVVAKRIVKGTPFSVDFSMEGPQYYKSLRYNHSAHKHDHFYSTTSFESEIPLPYFSFEEYGNKIQAPAVNFSQAIKGAVFLARNCNSRNNREALVKSLINSDAGIRVDSVSKCLHNAEVPSGLDSMSSKKSIMSRYLFYLAFENQCEDDYITEKLWSTFEAGTIPVYYGAPNVEEHVPPNSIINANAFSTSEDLAKFLVTVANNKTLYDSFHTWRTQPLPEFFLRKYNITRTHSTCRTCRWAAAKKYGLGWNHKEQELEDLRIPRKVCHDSKGVVTHPFRETWLSGNDQPTILVEPEELGAPQSCETKQTSFSRPIRLGSHMLTRTVRSQDGVTDIYLEDSKEAQSTSANLILQMETHIDGPMNAKSFKSLSLRHYRFQDEAKRMTILTSRNAELKVTKAGVLELHIPHAYQAIKVRIIVEDIEVYVDSIDRSNFFGQMLTEDFLNPLEKFVVFSNPRNASDWEGRQMLTLGIISAMDDDEVETEDAIREEEEQQERAREAAESVRRSLVKVKDKAKEKADRQAISGVKKLIAEGIIKIRTDEEAQ